VQNKKIELGFSRRHDQVVKYFTKAFNKEKFEKFRNLLGITDNKININEGC
jgi:hypothetical protein